VHGCNKYKIKEIVVNYTIGGELNNQILRNVDLLIKKCIKYSTQKLKKPCREIIKLRKNSEYRCNMPTNWYERIQALYLDQTPYESTHLLGTISTGRADIPTTQTFTT